MPMNHGIFFTGRVQYHRDYKKRKLIFVDTTVKSGNPVFAPTWDIVLGVKQSRITEETYTQQYKHLMSMSYITNKDAWLELFYYERPVVLCCYCEDGKFCHRHLLIKYVAQVAKLNSLPFHFLGECPCSP